MTSSANKHSYKPPVAVGGVGGSGTRLIAQCMDKMGFFLGDDLNQAHDNLWFALLFTRPEILPTTDEEFDALASIYLQAMTGCEPFTTEQIDKVQHLVDQDRLQHPRAWLQERAESLLSPKETRSTDTLWGWKAPNTHIVLERLAARFPGMKYIHVVRNGLDMAFSDNQNQLKIWGKHFLGDEVQLTPCYSLRYWCLVHKRVMATGGSMGDNFLFLNYEQFCATPEQGINRLADFLGVSISDELIQSLTGLVQAPGTIGRYRSQDISVFDEEDIAYVAELGFDTTTY